MKHARRHRVALIAYDQLRTFEYAIAAELFALPRPSLGIDWYETFVVSPDRGRLAGIGGVEVAPTAPFARIREADTIVVPGWRDVETPPPKMLLDAIRTAARRGARLVSICSGAFVLAHAGVLDGRRATTHWLYADQLKAQFPHVTYEDDVLYIDEGNVITSAGSAAGLDACLHVIRSDFGAKVANAVARRMVVSPHREGGQAQFVDAPVAVSPPRGIGSALDWARKRLNQPMAVAQLAKQASMSPRTFFRRCSEQLGVTPNQWLQRERVARARDLLEGHGLTLDEVSAQCGYESLETFRVAFKRVTGIAPGAYRRTNRSG